MKKLIIIAFTVISSYAMSQPYKSAIGGKLGYGLVGSYKFFIAEKSAFDIFAGFGWYGNGLHAGVNYNYQMPLTKDIKSLYWYVGGGLAIATYSNASVNNSTNILISGNIGIEYGFTDIPLTIGAEYMPSFGLVGDYTGNSRFGSGYGSLIVRYKLGK